MAVTKPSYLTVTFRNGKFLAAYLDLAKPKGDGRVKTKQLSDSVLLDIDAEGNPVGVEILSHDSLNAATLNALLSPHGVREITEAELNQAQAA
jgi:uncharacterized protein YuzE